MPLVTAATGDTPTRVHDFSLLIRPALERIGEAVSGAAARKPSGLEIYLRNRLHGLARRATDWLDSLSFHAAARLCEVVGAVALHGPQVKLNAMTDHDWWEVGDIGYDALADGADGLRTVLDRLSSNYWSRAGCTGPKGLFGRLYMWLAHETDDPDYEPVREVITNHVMDTMPVGPGDEIFGKPVTERRLWSVYTASRQSDVIPQRLRKMLAAAEFIAGNTDDMTDHRVVFPATPEVNKFLERTASMMSLKKAGDYLNIPRVQLYLLYRNGVITPFIGGSDDNAIDPAFTSGYLDEFLARLTADATERTDVDTGLADIPHTAKTARCSAVDIVQMLLERRLTRVRLAPDLTGFRSVLVDPDEIRQLMHRPREEGMIMKEVELTMRWSGTVVRALVENGWLPSRQALNPINNLPQTLVDRHDLDSFNADYASLHGLAREHGRHFMILKHKIDAAGIRPAFCPDMAKATFYRRADLPPL